ncbi:MAG: glycosyltransferase family 2 protein [Synergistaceae bacterium]|jgi:glycosyltransferase involved in cell wall biosynthesis|nr:glycosyltransferase family 2 protein [Synergistaceae bacterium]
MLLRSLIIPIYKNEANIPFLLEALRELTRDIESMEVVFVVDGSPDDSWALLRALLPEEPYPSRLVLLSRNFGSSSAIRTGIEFARGEHIAVMAADLQEPPQLVKTFFETLESDEADIVAGQRVGRKDPLMSKMFSNLYWTLYRYFINQEIPPGGVDVFACNKKVADVLAGIKEHHSYIAILLFWVGFRRKFVPYERQERRQGKSAWTFRKKTHLFLDTVFSFSDFPILLLTSVGSLGILLSAVWGAAIFIMRLLNKVPVQGYTTLLLVMLLGFSSLLFTQGIIGCYLWRCFENTKARPLAIVAGAEDWNGGEKTGEGE